MKKQDEIRAAAAWLLERLNEGTSRLAVLDEDQNRVGAMLPAELQQYLAGSLKMLCGQDGPDGTGDKTARRYTIGGRTYTLVFLRNGVVNLFVDSDLVAAADLGKPWGELETKAQQLFATSLLNTLRIFI